MAMHFHHWFFQLAVAGSTILWVIAALIFEAFNANGIRGGIHRMLSSASFWVKSLFAWLVHPSPCLTLVWRVIQLMLPVALTIALFHETVFAVYTRLFRADYRDLVKEVSLLGRDHGEPLNLHQKLGVWDVDKIPVKSAASQRQTWTAAVFSVVIYIG